MTVLLYTIAIQVEKPLGTLGLLGPVTVTKVTQQGPLHDGAEPSDQLKQTCTGQVAGLRTKLRKAANWTSKPRTGLQSTVRT